MKVLYNFNSACKVEMHNQPESVIVNSLLLKNIIESNYNKNDVKVVAYNVEPASPPYDLNFRSALKRVFVRQVHGTILVIHKFYD